MSNFCVYICTMLKGAPIRFGDIMPERMYPFAETPREAALAVVPYVNVGEVILVYNNDDGTPSERFVKDKQGLRTI